MRLSEAIQRYSDEQKWQAYQDAAMATGSKRRRGVIVVGGEPIAGSDACHRVRTDNALIDLKEKAWKDFVADFTGRLQSGELIATGVFGPLNAQSQRQVIHSGLWAMLRPNFANSSAMGGGCQVFAVRVMAAQANDAPPAGADVGAVFAEGLVGRPSCMVAIAAEMNARAARAELSDPLTDECRQLAEWARESFRPRRTHTPNTIRNELSSLYRQLKSRQVAHK